LGDPILITRIKYLAELLKVIVDAVFNPFKADVSVGSAQKRGTRSPNTKGWESLYVGMESNIGKENSDFR